MNKGLSSLLFVFLTIYCFGQSPKEQLKIANAANVGVTDFYEEISFVDRSGYFIIPVSIGSKTYEYIFDTGGYNTVTTEIMKENQLPELMKVTVGSSNQIKSKVSLSKIPRLNVGHISFTDVGVFNFDFDESPIIKCYTNGGLLGKGVIRQSVWQIDYPNKIIRLADNVKKMPNLENSIKLKVELDKVFNPFFQAEIDGRTQKFMLDFGFGGFISLTEKTANEYRFVTTIETEGEGAIGANGVNKESMFISKLTTVRIAGQSLDNQVALYSKSNNYNLIGSEIAKHFIVTLNFKEKELILTPIVRASVDPFKSFGIDLNMDERDIYISRIYKGLDGDKKGLQLKDRIISVNKIAVDSLNLCDSYFKIRETLHQMENLTIKVNRDNAEKEIKLQKTELR
jgi:predicted aspartyl protease